MFPLESLEIGALIEYCPGERNYDIGYVKDIKTHSNGEIDFKICWFYSAHDTVENELTLSEWHSFKAYKVNYADNQE